MEKIHFIPDKQKRTFEVASSDRTMTFGVLIGICSTILVVYIGGVYAVQYWFLEQTIDVIRTEVTDLDNRNSAIYPDNNVAGMIGTVSELVGSQYDIDNALMMIRTQYLPQTQVNTVSYSKQSKNVRINVELDSLEAIIDQVDVLSKLDLVESVEYSNFNSSKDGEKKSAELNITLK